MGGADAAPAIAEGLRRNHRMCDGPHGHGWMDKIDGRTRCGRCNVMQYKFIYRCGRCHVELCWPCKMNRA